MKKVLPFAKDKESGQTVLVVLLVMAVMLTIGLSVVSRSVTDIKISQQSQEAARALWVAQAGLEKAVKANAQTDSGILNSISYQVSRQELSGEEFIFPEKVGRDEIKTFWLVSHDSENGQISESEKYEGSKLTVYWGESADLSDSTPALEATYLYKNGGSFYFKRFTFDPFSARSPSSHFSSAGNGDVVLGKNFPFSGVIDVSVPGQPGAIPYLLRLRLIYGEDLVSVGVKAQNRIFPSQGRCYESTAQIVESGVTRKLQDCRLWAVTPEIFDFILLSGGGISQQ